MRIANCFFSILLLTAACADSSSGGDDSDDTSDAPPRVDAGWIPIDDAGNFGDPTLVDDFEDGEGAIHEILGRQGAWYSFNDGTAGGVQMPSESGAFVPGSPGAGESQYAARFQGEGWKTWGAGIGVDFKNSGESTTEMKGAWDASAYKGIAFEAKGNVMITVSLQQTSTVSTAQGGSCVSPPAPMEDTCGDGFGKAITLTDEYKTYEIPFTLLKQNGWGQPTTFDAKTLTGFMAIVAQNQKFDFYIDNLRYYSE
jgi:hypothetical protein